jgi:Xaa-Pro aminopeptidase
VRLFTDFRYAETARVIEGVEFVEAKRDLFQTLSEMLSGRIGFEATSVTYERHARLHAGGVDLVPRYGLVEELRAVKDHSELEAIGRAARITDSAFTRFAEEGMQGGLVGRTERELAWWMERLLHEADGDSVAFPVLVASGPNAAKPHTTSSGRKVGAGETVIVDAGCVVDGYCSDCTRTFATGETGDEAREIYELVLRAQRAALEAVAPGPTGREVDAVARQIIEEAGHGEHFGHGLGHGVGLDVHEGPRLSRLSGDRPLVTGNVVTVEPGVYLPGRLGVRIEDLVVVTEDGADTLSRFPKELMDVG